jgi:hypothetical protein
VRIEHPHEDVQIAVVERRLELRAETGRFPFGWLKLAEIAGRNSSAPHCVIFAPVDHRRRLRADCDGASRTIGCSVGGEGDILSRHAQRRGDQGDRRNSVSHHRLHDWTVFRQPVTWNGWGRDFVS